MIVRFGEEKAEYDILVLPQESGVDNMGYWNKYTLIVRSLNSFHPIDLYKEDTEKIHDNEEGYYTNVSALYMKLASVAMNYYMNSKTGAKIKRE